MMSADLLEDTDTKFLANNFLTSEDWDNYGDFEGLELGLGSEFPSKHFLSELSELPNDLKLTLKDGCLLDDDFPDSVLPDDICMDSSDSSDSGIHGVTVKSEPLSPVSSLESDLSTPECLLTECFDFQSNQGSHSFPNVGLNSNIESTNFIAQTPVFNHSSYIIDSSPIKVENLRSNQQSVHSILNSQIKIRPKPNDEKPSSRTEESKKALVLSPEEFTRLTSQGLIQLPKKEPENPVQTVPVLPAPINPQATLIPNTASGCLGNAPVQSDSTNRVLKRQQRMIKNRESASLSRKKKKEYVHTLEDKIKSFNTENHKLRVENETLKQQLEVLQSENQRLKVLNGGNGLTISPPRTRTCLLALVVMLTLNLAPWSGVFVNDVQFPVESERPVIRAGRHLMATREEDTSKDFVDRKLWQGDSLTHDHLMKRIHQLLEMEGHVPVAANSSLSQSHRDCPTYPNSTESIRLAEKLAGWMLRHEQEQRRTNHQRKTFRPSKKKHLQLKKVKAAMKGKYPAQHLSPDGIPYEVDVFRHENTRHDFLSSLHQRNDTFYVLSFNSDYFLLPATAYNKTTRPRMSLVMPALVNLNETLKAPEGSVSMMQIDCEVFDTRLIHVHKMAVPDFHHRQNQTKGNG